MIEVVHQISSVDRHVGSRTLEAGEARRHFASLSSERWAEASIAAGTDSAEAHAAAARTTDFYSGHPAA